MNPPEASPALGCGKRHARRAIATTDIKRRPAADAKEVGQRVSAEETCCHRTLV